MLREGVFMFKVGIRIKTLETNRRILTSNIVNKLLKQLSNVKACEHGYLLSVTKIISIGNGDTKSVPECIVFPVDIRCRIFTPVDGEVMTGIVHRVHRQGIFLRSGPMNFIYLSALKMPNYNYVPGKNIFFMRDDLSQIRIGVVLRFIVLAVRWSGDKFREFKILASIDGDGLGPVSLNGLDGLDL